MTIHASATGEFSAARQSVTAHAHHHHRHFHLHWHLLDTVRSTLSITIWALFFITFVVQPFRIPSESMERTLLVGDFLLADRVALAPAGHWGWLLPYHPVRRGDIVIFHFPLDPEDHVVKRVIGVPGDRVELRDGRGMVNDEAIQEPYATFEPAEADAYRDQFPHHTTSDPAVDPAWRDTMHSVVAQGAVHVPPAGYFVLGDNRNHSRDSRYWGFVPRQNIVGTPLLVYFSHREPSTTDAASLPDVRLGNSIWDRLTDLARWDRILRVIH